jgi:hypothetical protein
MMKTLYFLLFFAATPGALAAPATSPEPQPQPQQENRPVPLEQACRPENSPFADQSNEPKLPSSHTREQLENLQGDQWSNLRFDEHCRDDARRVKDCDKTLGLNWKYYMDARRSLGKLYGEVCRDARQALQKCAEKQAEMQKCMTGINRKAADEFKKIGEKLKAEANDLRSRHERHSTDAKNIADRPPAKATAPAASMITSATQRQEVAESRLLSYINKLMSIPVLELSKKKQDPKLTRECANEVSSMQFCGHVTAASESALYYAKLKGASDISFKKAKAFDSTAKAGQENVNKGGNAPGGDPSGGNPGGGEKPAEGGGLLDKVGGLDGLMKMATLGMMGGSLYCTVSGQCGQQQDAGDSSASSSDPASMAATSPTPDSIKTASTPLNDTEKEPSSGSTALGSTATDTDTNTFSAGGGGLGSGGGFSSSVEPDSALAPFNGSLDRAPASIGSVGGGSSGGGGSDSSGSSSDPAVADALKAMNSSDSGLLASGGGGGLGGGGFGSSSAGGFSLAESAPAASADASLKSILNGDAPLDSAGLPSLLDGSGEAGESSLGGNVELQGTDSLFLRVRDTYSRCVKRGCVGRGISENI